MNNNEENFSKFVTVPISKADLQKYDYSYGDKNLRLDLKTAFEIVSIRQTILTSSKYDLTNTTVPIAEKLEKFYNIATSLATGQSARKYLWPLQTVIQDFGAWIKKNPGWILNRHELPSSVFKFIAAYLINPRINFLKTNSSYFRSFGDFDNLLAGLFILHKLQEGFSNVFIVEEEFARIINEQELDEDWERYYFLPYSAITLKFNYKMNYQPQPFEIYAIAQTNPVNLSVQNKTYLSVGDKEFDVSNLDSGDSVFNVENEKIYYAYALDFLTSLGWFNPQPIFKRNSPKNNEYLNLKTLCQKIIVHINKMRTEINPVTIENPELAKETYKQKKNKKQSNVVILKPFQPKQRTVFITNENPIERGPIQCRYSVREHTRKQRFGPGFKYVKEVRVHQHEKGPENAPFKKKQYKIQE